MAPRIRRRLVVLSIALTAVAGWAAPAAHAQDRSTLAGTVRDTTGAVLPGATITVVNTATGAERVVTTDTDGRYIVPALPAGSYEVTATLSGFGTASRPAALEPATEVAVDLVLAVGGYGESLSVTALKRGEERLGDVPLAVSAVSGRQIEDLGATSVLEIAQLAPGATMFEGMPGQNRPQIRGLSSSVGDATVGYYLDETPWSILNSPTTPDTGLFDLERVEVLRGPQGTLYGDSAMGGVFRFITASPNLSKLEGKVDVSSSAFDGGDGSYVLNAAGSLPIVKDRLAVRTSVSFRKLGGWLDSTVLGDNVNTQEYGSYRVKALFKATEHLSLTASAWASRLDADAPNNALDDGTTDVPFEQPNEYDYNIYSVVADYSTPKVSILNAASYLELDTQYIFPLLMGPGLIAPVDFWYNSVVKSNELRLSVRPAPALRVTAGTMFKHIGQPTGASVFGAPLADQLQTSTSWAVFGEATYTAGIVDVTAGLRHYRDTRRVDDFVQDMDVDRDFTATTPRVNVGIRAAKGTLIYANAAQGFRSGLLQNPLSYQIADLLGIAIPDSIQPESAWTYEAGVKTELLNGRLGMEGAFYVTDYRDLQTWLPLGTTGITAGYNVGSALIPGMDWALRWYPVDGLSIAFSGNVNDAHYTDTVSANGLVAVNDGERVVYVPATTHVVAARYSRPLRGTGWLGFADISNQHSSGVSATATGTDASTEGFNNARFRAGIQNGRVEIAFFVENLTNERRPTAPGTFGTPWDPRLPPRAIGINLKVRN